VGDEFIPVVVNQATLQAMDPSAVLICRWPRPLRCQFYRNLLPDLQVTLCNSCNKVWTTHTMIMFLLVISSHKTSSIKIKIEVNDCQVVFYILNTLCSDDF
jgi:hypothetical protein